MHSEGTNPILDFMRHIAAAGEACRLTDCQLLERFVTRRDEAAFETLLHRHGAMVLRVCRRLLRDSHAAEDAFQATFLVFVRKAASIAKPELLGNWLYGVAYRVALRARKARSLRAAQERQGVAIPTAPTVNKATGRGGEPLVEEELQHLPAKYRSPMVLCYLEGRTNEEAAQQLQWPVGTVKVRLMRGREMLRRRLARSGLALSGGALTTILSQNAAPAAVPPALVDTTIRAALLFAAGNVTGAGALSAHTVALTEGVLKTMLWNQLKILAAVLLTVGLLATGAGWFAYRILAADQKPVKGHTVVKTNAKEAKQDNKNKQPKQVPLQLEKALAKAAEEAYHANWNDVVVGRIIPDEATCQWSRRWLKAQLPLSKKKAGQVAAYTAHRDRMKKLEKIAKEEFDGGKIAAKHYGTVKYFLVEAEIWLARAKSGE